MEDIKDTINRLYDFLTERSKSGDRQVADAAYNALRRLNAVSKRSDLDSDALYNYVLGDQKQYYTGDEIESMGDDIRQRELRDIAEGRLYDDGSIPGFYPESFRLTNVGGISGLQGRDGRPIGGVRLEDYLNPDSKISDHVLTENWNNENRYYKFDKRRPYSGSTFQDYVLGDFIGAPNHFDKEYNIKHKAAIDKAIRDKRYDEAQRYVTIRRDYDNGQPSTFHILNLDQIPSGADTMDEKTYELFPIPQMKLPMPPAGSSNNAIHKWMNEAKKHSQWDVVNNSEQTEARKNRYRKMDRKDPTQINGAYTQELIDKLQRGYIDTPTFNDVGVNYSPGARFDPRTGKVFTVNHDDFLRVRDLAHENMERVRKGQSFSRGGRMSTPPKSFRVPGGYRVGRAEGLGNDEYDVYF